MTSKEVLQAYNDFWNASDGTASPPAELAPQIKVSPTGSQRTSVGKPLLHMISFLAWPEGSDARQLHEWFFRVPGAEIPDWRPYTVEISKVLEKGLLKYPRLNWAKGQQSSWLVDSALRHQDKIQKGQLTDDESGDPHYWHFWANVMLLEHSLTTRPELDDRP